MVLKGSCVAEINTAELSLVGVSGTKESRAVMLAMKSNLGNMQ